MVYQSDAMDALTAGQTAFEDERYTEARAELLRAIDLEPGLAEAYPLLVHVAIALMDIAMLQEIFIRVERDAPQAIPEIVPILQEIAATSDLMQQER